MDTHCHLDCEPLLGRLTGVLAAAREQGVTRFIVPGVHPDGWQRIAQLHGTTSGVFPAFGVHPAHADLCTDSTLEQLWQVSADAVAIGEIGLDYWYGRENRDQQIVALRSQVHIALDRGLPVLLHCRAAFQDLLRIVREERVHRIGGVMHAYSGSLELAREFIAEGLFISLAGPVTYGNAVKTPRVARGIPLDWLLLESDAPDLAPEPYRGQTNEPAFLLSTAGMIARLRGISLETLAEATTANGERLFGFTSFIQHRADMEEFSE